jgi:hypothetical protein
MVKDKDNEPQNNMERHRDITATLQPRIARITRIGQRIKKNQPQNDTPAGRHDEYDKRNRTLNIEN